MRTIELTQGQVALVDDADYDRCSAFKWCANWIKDHYRPVRTDCSEGKRRRIYLYRFVMGVTDKDILVDHKDGNALNCVRSNLRVCNFAQNNRNRKKPVSKESSYKGVRKHRHGRWRASIKVNGVTINLGVFDVELDAARAYDAAASKHFGEFAKTNLESAA